MNTKCYNGQITIGDSGLVYGYYNSVLYTAGTESKQVVKGVTLPQSSSGSLAYIGEYTKSSSSSLSPPLSPLLLLLLSSLSLTTNTNNHLGSGRVLTSANSIFITNITTNTYESYSTDLSAMLPESCRLDNDIFGIGSTLNGLIAYVRCYSTNTYGAVKFTIDTSTT